MRRKTNTIAPLYQGDLDGLCGLYAIINAVRRIIPKRHADRISEDLFELLLSYAIKEQGNLMVAYEGIGLREIRQLLCEAINYLNNDRQLQITLSQPWRLQLADKPSIDDLISFNQQSNTSILIGLETPNRHWSVIDTISRSQVRLFDSDSHGDIKTEDLFLRRNTSSLLTDYAVIPPNSIFILNNANRRTI